MAEQTGKDLFLSKAFIGAVLLIVSVILKAKGVEFDHEEWTGKAMGFIEAILPYAGGLLAIIGTLFRKKEITSVAGVGKGVLEKLGKLLP